jgi:hypothetical protein
MFRDHFGPSWFKVNLTSMFDLLADRCGEDEPLDLLASRIDAASFIEIAPALSSAIVLAPVPASPNSLKRKAYSRTINGVRVRTIVPGAKPMSRRESLCKARGFKQKHRCDIVLQQLSSTVASLADDVAATTRLRVNQSRFQKRYILNSTKMIDRLDSLCTTIHTSRSRRTRKLTPADVSETAIDNSGNRETRARAHQMSERSEARITNAHSLTALTAQEITLQSIEQELGSDPPDWSIAVPLWDETCERVQVSVPQVQRLVTAALQMFVYIISFAWGWRSGRRCSIRLVCPPIAITTTTASKLWDAMRTHPFTAYIWRFKRALAALTIELPLEVATTDQASGNVKLLAFQLLLSTRILYGSLPCLNHQCFLGHLDVVLAVFSATFLSHLHSVARFFNMGAHRLRCVMVVPGHLRSHTDFTVGFSAKSDMNFAEELINYAEVWESLDDNDSAHKTSKLLRRFFDIVGGGYGRGFSFLGIAPFTKRIGRPL